MRFRFSEPDALFLVDLLIRLGEVGAFDLEGSLRKVGNQIGELLGELPESSRLYRGMRALAGRTCLVERVSRQIWRLALAGITDPASPRHQRLLDETPSPCRLEVDAGADLQADLPAPKDPDDGELEALRAQLDRLAAEARGVAGERDEAKAELVAQREVAAQLAAELDEARHDRDAAARSERAQAEKLAAELRRFDDVVLERDIKIEDLERQLASVRTTPATEPLADAEADKQTALKATLKAERELRRAAENRLRKVLSALRVKLEVDPGRAAAAEMDLDNVLWGSLSAVLAEHLDALEAEDGQDDVEPDPGRAGERQTDVGLAEAILLRAPRGGRESKPPRR